jgi:hypothetical protein
VCGCGAATTQQSIVIVVIRMVQPFRFRMKTLNGQRVTDVRVFDTFVFDYRAEVNTAEH